MSEYLHSNGLIVHNQVFGEEVSADGGLVFTDECLVDIRERVVKERTDNEGTTITNKDRE